MLPLRLARAGEISGHVLYTIVICWPIYLHKILLFINFKMLTGGSGKLLHYYNNGKTEIELSCNVDIHCS